MDTDAVKSIDFMERNLRELSLCLTAFIFSMK